MKKRLFFVLLAAFLLCGCGKTAQDATSDAGGAEGNAVPTEAPAVSNPEQDAPEDSEVTPETEESTPTPVPEDTTTGEEEMTEEKEDKIMMNGISIEIQCPTEITQRRAGVTYGTVIHHTYYSETTGMDRGVNVLMPADYDPAKTYPTLYLLHGIFGDENSFTGDSTNRIPEIFGNLYADGLAAEMIVVFPHMYATTDPNLKPGFTQETISPYDNFINDLVNDLMPYIEANYSVSKERDQRAIAGFSMGGRETLFIGLSRPDLFAYVGAIAPAPGLTPGKDWAMEHPGQLAEEELTFVGKEYEPTVLMVCCGTGDSVVGKFPLSYHEIFTTNEVEHVWYEVTGADHDNTAIRSGLYNFVRAIFKD